MTVAQGGEGGVVVTGQSKPLNFEIRKDKDERRKGGNAPRPQVEGQRGPRQQLNGERGAPSPNRGRGRGRGGAASGGDRPGNKQ